MFIEQADDSPHKLDASIVVFLHQRPLRVQGSQSVFSVFLDKQCIIYLEDANFTITRCIVTLNTFLFFKWIFKTFAAVLIVTNTWNIVMAVFDVAQNVVSQASGIIIGDTALDAAALLGDMEQALMAMEIGPLFGLWSAMTSRSWESS